MEVLKAAVSAVPKDISDKDRETLNRAYQKRRNEVTPMTQEAVDVVLAKIKSATTTEELSDVWKLEVDAFTGVITEAQNAVFNTAFYNQSDEMTTPLIQTTPPSAWFWSFYARDYFGHGNNRAEKCTPC